MSTVSPNFDKYIAGEPINEELRALKEGRAADAVPFLVTGSQNQSTEPSIEPISRAEQIALKELRGGPAWPVLQKLLKNATLLHKKSATLLSEGDPLADAQKIAEAWAYVKMLNLTITNITRLVEAEITKLDEGDSQ